MAKRNSRKRRIKGTPFYRWNTATIITNIIELIVLIVALFFGNRTGDAALKIIAILGTISIVFSGIGIVISLRGITGHEYSLLGRILALVLSIICFISWTWIYIIGLTA